jgi:hypothetical protein
VRQLAARGWHVFSRPEAGRPAATLWRVFALLEFAAPVAEQNILIGLGDTRPDIAKSTAEGGLDMVDVRARRQRHSDPPIGEKKETVPETVPISRTMPSGNAIHIRWDPPEGSTGTQQLLSSSSTLGVAVVGCDGTVQESPGGSVRSRAGSYPDVIFAPPTPPGHLTS